MFLSYDTIGYIKGPEISLVKDVETGTVAVRKKLRPELLDVYHRLMDETCPYLPRVYETEEYEGECFAYYEYTEGETLEDMMQEGSYTIDEAEKWMEQLCVAMAALHAMKPSVVHRDIKPENIIISKEGNLKLIDLGAARMFKQGRVADTEQIGTRGYAAPEQYGFNQSDSRTDIYAAGIVLHAVMERFNEKAKPYEAIAARCARLDPKDRFISAQAMRRALIMAKHKRTITAGCAALAVAAAALICVLVAGAINTNADKQTETALNAENTAEQTAAVETPTAVETAAAIETPEAVVTPEPEKTETPAAVSHANGQNVVASSVLSEHYGVYTKDSVQLTAFNNESFYAAYQTAFDDTKSHYYIAVGADITLDGDFVIYPNMTFHFFNGSTLTVPSGSVLSNYGVLCISRNSTLRIDDGAVLNLGRFAVNESGEERYEFIYIYGTMSMGKNTEIWFERDAIYGDGPALEIWYDKADRMGRITFDDVSTVKFQTIGIRYIYCRVTEDPVSENGPEFMDEVFPAKEIAALGYGGVVKMCFEKISSESVGKMACEYFENRPDIAGVVTFEDATVGDGAELSYDGDLNVYFAGTNVIESGCKIETFGNTTLSADVGSALTVESGGTLNVFGSYFEICNGASITAENGAAITIGENTRQNNVTINYK